MSITITGGISFSGGVGIVAPPPSEATAGWYSGGMNGSYIAMSTVCRITYATDTATATTRGPLASVRNNAASVGNLNYGWTGGGNGGAPSFTIYSSVNRITYATDTATASGRGPLSAGRYGLGAAGNTTYGWFAGGATGSVGGSATVDRVDYANDTATASVRGPLSLAKYDFGAAGNETAGWFAGGTYYAGVPTYTTAQVESITYATDTASTSIRGPLSSARYRLGATGNATDGWFGGGSNKSTVDRITYATDTATASVRGPLSLAREGLTASGNSTEGWFGGGYTGGATRSTVDRITYATDTNTASVRGPLSFSLRTPSASAGLQ